MITTPHDEKGHQYYDSIYARGYATHGYYPLYDHIIKIMEKDGMPHRVLEIGCGVGDLGKLIVERGHQYRGFDFSPVAVECCRALCPQADFRIGDAYNPASYIPHDYDTAVALEVLEHLDDLRMIGNIPIGVRLIASVPDYDDVAHLRLYKDPKRDILDRFRPLLHVTEILSLVGKGHSGEPKTVYLFQGVRVANPDEFRVAPESSYMNPSGPPCDSDPGDEREDR
jgi:SAM-dependent methyltransferase